MPEVEAYAPHETRMLALEMAVEFINGDKSKARVYTADLVIGTAEKFEEWLTAKPIPGFEAKAVSEE